MPFWWNPPWLRDTCAHMGGSRDIPNMDCEPSKSKWLAKGNLEQVPHKSNSNCHEGAALTPSLSEYDCTHRCTVLFPPLINTLLASLLFIFVEILFCKDEGPGPLSLTTVLVTRIWCFHCCDTARFPAGNPSPILSHCTSRPPEISFHPVIFCHHHLRHPFASFSFPIFHTFFSLFYHFLWHISFSIFIKKGIWKYSFYSLQVFV